ncbi:MAG: HypC/HybG/HupF family hydrogenase formation chaperone [Candidatus Omnitrophota bacterium]
MCLATPAKIKKIEETVDSGKTAIVDFGGVQRRISLGILNNAKIGDYVLVHAGFAIGKVSKLEAENTKRALEELRRTYEGAQMYVEDIDIHKL